MSDEKQYYAFISYKREDEKWAKWLQKKLEHYRFPTNLNGYNDLPKNIRPTFRDVTDLEPGILSEKIDSALRDSQWLIVVCSPRSAKSPWVCKEAQTFIDLGLTDHIIPFIIEGIPQSNDPVTECYPDAILHLPKEQELLGANINEMGRDAAAIKVVARMFGLKFDTLWQRHEREKRRKVIIFTTIILLIFALLSYFLFREIRYSKELNQKNELIERQNKNLIQSRDSTRIALRNVQEKNDTLTLTRLNLENSNAQLTQSNWHAMEVQARAVSIKALELIAEGDIYRGLALIMKIMPQNKTNPERPFIPEMERAIRAANDSILYGRKVKCIMKSHYGCVYDAVLSRDDKIAATTSNDNTIRFWDLKTGEEYIKMRMSDFRHNINYIAFSPDGKYFIKRYSKEEPLLSVWIVDKTGLKFLKKLQLGCFPKFSSDGKILYVRGKKYNGSSKERIIEEKKIYVYETKSWNAIGRADDLLDSLYVSCNGFGILRGTDFFMSNEQYLNRLSFMSMRDSTYAQEQLTFPSCIRSAKQFTTSDDIFIITDDGSSFVCHNPYATPRSKALLITERLKPFAVSTKYNYFLTEDGEVYDVATSSIKWFIQGKISSYTGRNMAVNNDGSLAAYIRYSKGQSDIIVHNNLTNDSLSIKNPFPNGDPENEMLSLALSDDGHKIIAGFRNSHIIIWDVHTAKIIHRLHGHQNGVTSVAFFGKDKYVISSSHDNTTRIWDLRMGKELDKKRIHLNISYDGTNSAVSPNTQYVATSNGEYIYVYDYETNSIVSTIPSSDCVETWFDVQNNLYSLNVVETDTISSYKVFKYHMPSIDKLCKQYSYLRSFYLSQEEKKIYYLE